MPTIVPSTPYATVEDVRLRWEQDLPVEDEPRVQALIDDATAVIQARVPTLEQSVTDGKITPETVRAVVVGMVLRILRNPGGFRSEQDGDYSYSMDRLAAGGALFLSSEDLRLLRPRGRVVSLALSDDGLRYPTRRRLDDEDCP